jgi:hypothetical protein
MHTLSLSAFIFGTATLAVIAATASESAKTEEAHALEVPEVSCSVTDEQIVAATAHQEVTLDTHECTASVRHMVEHTFSEIHKAYAAFYKQTHLNPAAAADVSLLLVRRQLLSGSWSAGSAEHYTISKDSLLLKEIEERLHEYLTSQQISSLEVYEKTIPARTFIEPVVSRLEKQGRAVSELQYDRALQMVSIYLAEWLKVVPTQKAADPRQACIEAHALVNRRDERIREILARSLDEEQQEIAESYYRDLFERRSRSLRIYGNELASDDSALCSYTAF